jgi:hypothetical protein
VEEVMSKNEGPWGQMQVALTVISEFLVSVTTTTTTTPHPQVKLDVMVLELLFMDSG